MNTTDIKVFASKFDSDTLQVIYSWDALWLSQKDVYTLFGISTEELSKEMWNIFSNKILSKRENVAKFQIWKNKKVILCFRIGFLISLWYRLKNRAATQFVIKTNRKIKSYYIKRTQKTIVPQKSEKTLENTSYLDILTRIIELSQKIQFWSKTAV